MQDIVTVPRLVTWYSAPGNQRRVYSHFSIKLSQIHWHIPKPERKSIWGTFIVMRKRSITTWKTADVIIATLPALR